MVLKDWKKITQGENIIYDNQNRRECISIIKYDLGDGRYFYSSELYDTFYNRRIRAFSNSKTKSQALKIAMKYMRSHPNG